MLRPLLQRSRWVRMPRGSGSVDIQRVEVTKKSKPLFTRFMVTFFISYCVIRTTTYLLSDDLKKSSTILNAEIERMKKAEANRSNQFSGTWTEQHAKITAADRAKRADADRTSSAGNDTIHLMLPVWFRQKQGARYKETDPEWQGFVALQKDRKRVDELKKNVGKMIGKSLGKAHHIVNLRYIQFKHQLGISLEVVPPIYPPEIYEVPCLFIAPKEARFGWRPLPEAAGSKLERIFHPVIFATAFFAGVKEFSIATFLITKARILDRYHETKTVDIDARSKRDQEHPILGRWRVTEEQKVNMRFPSTRSSEKDIKVLLPFLRGKYGEEGSRQKYRDLVRSMTYKNAIEHGCSVFNQKWISSQFAALQKAPRGACQIRGFVDCFGARGKYRLEVIAIYLPTEDAFVGQPIITGAYVIADLPKFSTTEVDSATVTAKRTTTETPVVPPKTETEPGRPSVEKPSDKDVKK